MADQRVYSGWKQNKWLSNVLGEEAKVAKCQNVLTQCVKKALDEKRAGDACGSSCLLDVLLSCEGLGQDEIVSTIVGFVILGYDRLASTAGFALMELAKQSEAQEKIRKEVEQRFPLGTIQATTSVKSLEAFLLETQRLYPATSVISKWVTEGVPLNGYFVPPNSSVMFYLQGTSREAQRFNSPDKFDVNRHNLNEIFGPNRHELNMPMTVMKVLVGNLVKKYQLRAEKGDVEIGSGLTMRMSRIQVNIKSR